MNIGIIDFQFEDALGSIPALSCLGGLTDECVDETM